MKYPVPNILNLIILLVSITAALFFLHSFEHSSSWSLKFMFAIGFGLVNNTIFALLHEATHGVLFSNRKLNSWGGRVAASFFPTSFTIQQIFHLGHHRRNRTDAEIFDQYYPHDNIWIKRFVIYSLLLGLYYPSSPLANIIFLFCPWMFDVQTVRKSSLMKLAGFDSMLSGLDRTTIPKNTMRLEILFTIGVQLSIVYFLGLSFWSWFLCYYAFNILWSSLQYTDHAWSKRDVREGAWNLKVNFFIEKIFLNYHFHLNHHRYPNVSWLYLPQLSTSDDPHPSFWSIYFKLWKGPTPMSEPAPTVNKDFNQEIYQNSEVKMLRQ